MLSSTEIGGEQIIIHNNAHSVIRKEPGGCITMFAINCGTFVFMYTVIIMLYVCTCTARVLHCQLRHQRALTHYGPQRYDNLVSRSQTAF